MKAKIIFEYDPKDESDVADVLAMQKAIDYQSIIFSLDEWLRGKIKWETPEIKLDLLDNYFNMEEYKQDQETLNGLTEEQIKFIQEQKKMVIEEIRSKLWELKKEYDVE